MVPGAHRANKGASSYQRHNIPSGELPELQGNKDIQNSDLVVLEVAVVHHAKEISI